MSQRRLACEHGSQTLANREPPWPNGKPKEPFVGRTGDPTLEVTLTLNQDHFVRSGVSVYALQNSSLRLRHPACGKGFSTSLIPHCS